MLLIFNNNDEFQEGGFICGATVLENKYVPSGSQPRHRDYTGNGKSRAILPSIIVCNQNLKDAFDTDKLDRHIDRS